MSSAIAAPDAGSLLQQQRPSIPERPQQIPREEASEPVQLLRVSDGGPRVAIRQVRFTGAQQLASDADLQGLVRDAIGLELGFAELEMLADRITRYLKKNGWILARAYLPAQEIKNGSLEIAILAGRIEGGVEGKGIDIQADGTLRIHEERIRKTVATALLSGGGASPTGGDLERAVLLVNDLAGIEARSTLERGTEAGASRLRVITKEAFPLGASLWIDNFGNRYTGSERANVLINLNSPMRIGDRFTVLATHSSGVNLGQLAYTTPIGYSGLTALVAGSYLDYTIGKEQRNLDARGTAATASAALRFPWIRSRSINLTSQLGVERKWLQDDVLGANVRDKTLNNLSLGLIADQYDTVLGGGLTNLILSVTAGRVDLSNNLVDLANDRASANSHGNFRKLSYSIARLQKITEPLSLFVAFTGQTTSDNLDSSEKFILGGPAGVRAYPTGEGVGDRGWRSSVELRYDLESMKGSMLGNVQLVGFYDHGRIQLQADPWTSAPNASGRNDYSLSGIGLGLNIDKTARHAIRIAWSRALQSNPGRSIAEGTNADGKLDKQRIWLTAALYF